MKAARFSEPNEPLRVEGMAIPEPGEEDVIVEVKAAGICGTDVHIAIEGTVLPAVKPITIGHEVAGIVHRCGEKVNGWKEGDRVVVYPQITCGECGPCRNDRESLCVRAKIFGLHIDGGFAEYLGIHQKCLIKLPNDIPFEEGAIIPDAVSTPYHAIVVRGGLRSGQSVAVFGCGGLGIHGIKIAKALGASPVIAVDISEGAIKNAKDAGADETINSSEVDPAKRIKELTNREGVDLSFEFVGDPLVIVQAVKCLKMGGKTVIVGIGHKKIELIPIRIFVGCEFELLGSMGSTRKDVESVINLLSSSKIDMSTSIAQRISLEEVNVGLNNLHKKIGDPIRIVIKF